MSLQQAVIIAARLLARHAAFVVFFTIATEAACWLAAYMWYCKRHNYLAFGRIRVKAFKFLMQRTTTASWRVRWAHLLFGRENGRAALFADAAKRYIDTHPNLRHTGEPSCQACHEMLSIPPDEVA